MTSRADHITEQGPHVAAEETLRAEVPDSILLPYQQRWVADAAPVKLYEKSRRIGISWAEAADAALYAASDSGANGYYLAYNQDMTQQFIKDCAWWASWYDLACGPIQEEEVLVDGDKSVKVYQVEFASGHVVQALSSAPRNLRSKGAPGERVILDEFAFHDDQAALLKAALAFLMWGGQVRIISTHHSVENGFNRLIQGCREGRKPYSVHRTTLREAVAQGLYKRIALVAGQEWTPEAEAAWVEEIYAQYGADGAEELDVVPQRSGTKYFPRILVEDCTDEGIPVLRYALNDEFALLPEYRREAIVQDWCEEHLKPLLSRAEEGLKSSFGLDFGRVGDLTVLIPAQEQANLTRRALFALELRNVPFEQQRQILFYVVDRLPRFCFGALDAGGNGAYLAEVAWLRYGMARIEAVKLSQPFYLEHMPRYKAAIDERRIRLPADSDLVGDHMDVERVSGVPRVPSSGRRKGTDGGQRHGDAAIAAMLLWYASRQGGAPIDFLAARGTARAGSGAYGTPQSAGISGAGWGAVHSELDALGGW